MPGILTLRIPRVLTLPCRVLILTVVLFSFVSVVLFFFFSRWVIMKVFFTTHDSLDVLIALRVRFFFFREVYNASVSPDAIFLFSLALVFSCVAETFSAENTLVFPAPGLASELLNRGPPYLVPWVVFGLSFNDPRPLC